MLRKSPDETGTMLNDDHSCLLSAVCACVCVWGGGAGGSSFGLQVTGLFLWCWCVYRVIGFADCLIKHVNERKENV